MSRFCTAATVIAAVHGTRHPVKSAQEQFRNNRYGLHVLNNRFDSYQLNFVISVMREEASHPVCVAAAPGTPWGYTYCGWMCESLLR